MKVKGILDALPFSVTKISVQRGEAHGSGTGLFLQHSWAGGTKTGDFLVTCRHVVEGTEKGSIYFHYGEKGQPLLGKTYTLQSGEFSKLWSFPHKPGPDVAVFPMGRV